VDDIWTAATTAAVKRWQKARAVAETGSVAPGEMVFLPSAVKVASHTATLGTDAHPGGEVLKATPAAQVVTVDLDAGRAGLLNDDAVEIELPDGHTIPGTVTSVATVATSGSDGMGGSGSPTLAVVITPDGSTGDLAGSPVTVLVTRDTAENVLAVPVHALLALAEGGYAVEVADEQRRLVAVETGLFADGLVQVTGDGLAEGTRVVVPE
jgi:hypothetical protein